MAGLPHVAVTRTSRLTSRSRPGAVLRDRRLSSALLWPSNLIANGYPGNVQAQRSGFAVADRCFPFVDAAGPDRRQYSGASIASLAAPLGIRRAPLMVFSSGPMDTIPTSLPPPWARILSIAGLVPFVAGAAALWALRDPVASARAGFGLAAYAATIAAFLGGVHWGPAMRAGGMAPAPLIWGVTPQLAGWLALLMPAPAGLLTCAAVLVACYAADRRLYPDEGLAAWLPMRLQLTVVAAASCIAGAAA